MTAQASDDDESTQALRARIAQLMSRCEQLEAERDHVAAERDHVAAERDHVAAERDHVAAERDRASAEVERRQKENRQLSQRAERLALQVKRLAYLLYGRRSEKLNAEQIGQLVLALGGSEHDAQQPDPNVPVPAAPEETASAEADGPEKKRNKRKHPGRTKLSPELHRIFTKVPVPDAERRCRCCDELMTTIDFREHERVEHEPEKLIVYVEQREVLVCKNSRCRGDAITAERQQAPAVARRAGASLLAHLIESKCDDALPIYRQRDRLLRLGFDVPLNTLYSYFAYGTDLLAPVAKVTLGSVLGESYVGVDDTKLKVIDKTHNNGRYLGHLWCFTGERGLVAYTFTESWDADEIAPVIAAIDGFIQCDDYKGYSKVILLPDGNSRMLVPPERRLGCMMHVRRRFHDAYKLGDKRASEPIAFIRELYRVEAEAKERALDAERRLELRSEKSLPWLRRLEQWVDCHEQTLLPTSKLGEACGYARQQRPYIQRCFTDGRFEIDNGRPERAIREPAIGRRNFHFTGSADAALRLAHAYTLVQSCRALGFPARDYLIDVLTKLEAGFPLRRIAELVPDRWAQDHSLLATSNQTTQQPR